MISHTIVRTPNPQLAVGQLGGHVKRGYAHPKGQRTGKTMALVSAVPLAIGSDKMVLAFMDRSDPAETFDYLPHKGDNAVVVVAKDALSLSVINGVCPGDWKGAKIAIGAQIDEPIDLDVDPTGLDLAASDQWVDLVDELGCDCSKLGGFPLWANAPMDVEKLVGRPQRFHHRLSGDVVDFKLGDGGVIYVFLDEDGTSGSLCWQQAK